MEITFRDRKFPVAEPNTEVIFDFSERQKRVHNLLKVFKQDIIQSYKDRMEACNSHFEKHYDTAIAIPNAMEVFEYTYPDGHTGMFNNSSYEEMGKAIKCVEEENWEEFTSNLCWIEQLVKGLLNQPNRPTNKVLDGVEIPFSNFVSLIVELLIFNKPI